MIYYGDALSYIKETPDVLSHILKRRKELTNTPALPLLGNAGDLIIVGTGSSYHAALAVKKWLQRIRKSRVCVLTPAELEDELLVCASDSWVIGISQQGTSVSVIEALDQAKKAGRKTIAMTGEAGTEITKHSEVTVMIECGEEDAGATTKGFSATAFTLILLVLGMAIGEEKEKLHWLELLSQIPDAVREALSSNQELMDHLTEELAGFEHLLVLSSEQYKDLMPELSLKFSETCRRPVAGMDVDTFCHGMYNVVQKNTTLLLISEGKNEKIHRLCKYYEVMGNSVIMWTYPEHTSDVVQLFVTIACMQYLFVQVSRKMGVDLNVPKDPEFHKIMRSKLETEKDS